MLLQVNKQLGGCQSNQGRLEQDLENKDVALDIDHTCHNIHNNSKDIQLHGGIERQVIKTIDTWEKKNAGKRGRADGMGEEIRQELARLAEGASKE